MKIAILFDIEDGEFSAYDLDGIAEAYKKAGIDVDMRILCRGIEDRPADCYKPLVGREDVIWSGGLNPVLYATAEYKWSPSVILYRPFDWTESKIFNSAQALI